MYQTKMQRQYVRLVQFNNDKKVTVRINSTAHWIQVRSFHYGNSVRFPFSAIKL